MKTFENESVVQEWTSSLTFQQQALLLTGIRGADGCSKHNNSKYLTRYLRGAVLKPAGNWRTDINDGDFMWGYYSTFHYYARMFYNDHDEYPHHYIMHLVHCAEVLGYKHPDGIIRNAWMTFYFNMCKSFHMTPETETEMDNRLNDFQNEKEEA